MNLSISNIGWESENDLEVYKLMKKYGFSGLEIAPTKIIPETPYEQIEKMKLFSEELFKMYSFVIPSMQSIWYGRNEKIFSTKEERNILLDYTKKAIDFASAIGCHNLVFGCPRNRNINFDSDYDTAITFFKEIGDYAYSMNTCIGMEANPPIYNTNFINDTHSAIMLIEDVNSKGFLLNLDIGTMIYNHESIETLKEKIHLVNHVHISEPYLKVIEVRNIHQELSNLLKQSNYKKYVSIEMGKTDDLGMIEESLKYISEVFG